MCTHRHTPTHRDMCSPQHTPSCVHAHGHTPTGYHVPTLRHACTHRGEDRQGVGARRGQGWEERGAVGTGRPGPERNSLRSPGLPGGCRSPAHPARDNSHGDDRVPGRWAQQRLRPAETASRRVRSCPTCGPRSPRLLRSLRTVTGCHGDETAPADQERVSEAQRDTQDPARLSQGRTATPLSTGSPPSSPSPGRQTQGRQ